MLQVIYIYESHVLFPQLHEKGIYFLHFSVERKMEKIGLNIKLVLELSW